MSNHTPGPWVLSTVDAGRIHGTKYTLSTNERSVTSPFAATDANAKLIAAAPDMAEALRVAYRFLSENYSTQDMPDILPVCRAALAKAGL